MSACARTFPSHLPDQASTPMGQGRQSKPVAKVSPRDSPPEPSAVRRGSLPDDAASAFLPLVIQPGLIADTVYHVLPFI